VKVRVVDRYICKLFSCLSEYLNEHWSHASARANATAFHIITQCVRYLVIVSECILQHCTQLAYGAYHVVHSVLNALSEVAEYKRVCRLTGIETGYVIRGEDLLMLSLRDVVVLVKVLMGDESVPVHTLTLMQPEVNELLRSGELGRGRN
jgi:hypothetical protein